MNQRPPPPFLRAPPLDRELSSGLAALRSYQPSAALVEAVEYALEQQILNELGAGEVTPSGVRARPAEPCEPRIARAAAPWDAAQALRDVGSPPPPRFLAVLVSGVCGALTASLAIGIVVHQAGKLRSEASDPVAMAALPARAAGASLAQASSEGDSVARSAAGSESGSEETVRVVPVDGKPALATAGRKPDASRSRSAAGERSTPEPCPVCPGAADDSGFAFREGGVLNINSIPLSKVVLDGRPIGGTPRVQIPVVAGYHTVVFIHAERGRIEKQIHVEPGRTVLAAVRFD